MLTGSRFSYNSKLLNGRTASLRGQTEFNIKREQTSHWNETSARHLYEIITKTKTRPSTKHHPQLTIDPILKDRSTNLIKTVTRIILQTYAQINRILLLWCS